MAISSFKGASGASDGAGQGFYLNVGSSGNTTYAFNDPQPPGVYFISSKLGDTTYDIYLSSESASFAGYADSEILVATDSFNKVVVYGATPNDVIILESKTTVNTNTSGDVDGGASPYLLSINPSDLESINDTTTVSGGNLATSVEIYFIGTNAVELSAKSIVRNSSQELIVTRPDNLIPDHAPYDVKAINPGVPLSSIFPEQHILFDAITAGAYPQWVTKSPLFWEQGETVSLPLVAQDAELSNISYTVIQGTLLSGMSLDANTGQITVLNDSIYNTGDSASIVVRATDSGGNTADRSFDIYINSVPIYSFYFDPFVSAGQLERILFTDLNL